MKKIICLICVLTFWGCSTEPKSIAPDLDDYLSLDNLFCIGFLEGNLHKTYKKTGSFPPNLDEYQADMYKLKPNCMPENQIRYQLVNNKTYLLRYTREDAQFDDSDYYFYPNYERTGKLGYPERKQEHKDEGHDAHIDYCTGFIGGGIEQYWKIFGYYPNSIHELNHPYMDEIYSDCIPKKKILYVRESPQTYSLQLPGYDGELDTYDDYFIRPTYGKDKLYIRLGNKIKDNQG